MRVKTIATFEVKSSNNAVAFKIEASKGDGVGPQPIVIRDCGPGPAFEGIYLNKAAAQSLAEELNKALAWCDTL